MKQLRAYVDASVVGGCYDEEFLVESRTFFELAGSGRFVLNAVNLREGYAPLAIHSLKELI